MSELFAQLIAPFEHAFMLRALLAVLVVSLVSGPVGSFIVLRGMAFYGNALAHSLLPGVALGYLISGGDLAGLFWWGLAAALVSSLLIGAVAQRLALKEDTAIGVVFAGMMALGIAMISTIRGYSADLTHFLFGDILAVTNGDLTRTVVFGGLVFLLLVAFFKEFVLLSFDPVLARTLRLPVKTLENLLLVLIALVVVIALQTVGIAMMIAVLVTPAATAHLIARRLVLMMLLASLFTAFSGLIGLELSYHANMASGAAIVLVTTLLFFAVWGVRSLMARRRGSGILRQL